MSQRSIEAIYQQIASNIMQAITEPWVEALIIADLTDDTGLLVATYKPLDNSPERDFNVDFDVYFAFDELRQQLQKPGHANWQQAKFKLLPDGQFNIDFVYPD
jgi:hypothetical protein